MGTYWQISVVVPVYNAQNTIVDCLCSLERQTMRNMEVLLLNDGSTDESERIIKEYSRGSNLEIRYFSDSNRGQAYARNFGIRHARGEYIAFVDSDDYLDSDYLKRLYDVAEAYHADVVNSGYRTVKEDGTVISSVNVSPFSEICDYGRAGIFAVWSKLFRKKFLLEQDLRFPEGKLYEDVPFSIGAKFRARSVKAVSYIGYNYVQHKNSVMSSAPVQKSRFPFEELDAAIAGALKQDTVRREALEFEVLHFFTGFLFLYCKRAARDDTQIFCVYAAEEIQKYFPEYIKNPFVGLKRSRELPVYYRVAIQWFVTLNRLHLLQWFVCKVLPICQRIF